MANQKIISTPIITAQPKLWDRLSQIAKSGEIGSAYLFSGPSGCGKEGIAIQFARLLNCEGITPLPCEICISCKRSVNLQHENFKFIFPLPTPKSASIDENNSIDQKSIQIVIDAISNKAKDPFYKINVPKANRILIQSIRELRKTLYLKGEKSGRKMVLIFDAHLLSVGQGEAANALLKLLEEPPDNTTLVLVTDYVELLMPTILSRCQRVGFPRLNDDFIQQWFEIKMIKHSEISFLTGLSLGNIHNARFLLAQSIGQLIELINKLTKTITQNKPEDWRKFIETYSRLARQDRPTFLFHFMILKIWFQSANRYQKGLHHILHDSSFDQSIKKLLKNYPDADFTSIIFELEETIFSIPQNLYMPLVLINLLLRIQKYLRL